MTCDYDKALEFAKEGKWDEAHKLVQPYSDPKSCLIHGYLHRVEGDLSNAGYWYRRAGKPHCQDSLDTEWAEIARVLLNPAPL